MRFFCFLLQTYIYIPYDNNRLKKNIQHCRCTASNTLHYSTYISLCICVSFFFRFFFFLVFPTFHFVAVASDRMNSIRSSKHCCRLSNRFRTPGSICRRPNGNITKSTRNECHWRRNDTARTNCKTKRSRSNRNGHRGCSASCAKTLRKSVARISCRA